MSSKLRPNARVYTALFAFNEEQHRFLYCSTTDAQLRIEIWRDESDVFCGKAFVVDPEIECFRTSRYLPNLGDSEDTWCIFADNKGRPEIQAAFESFLFSMLTL